MVPGHTAEALSSGLEGDSRKAAHRLIPPCRAWGRKKMILGANRPATPETSSRPDLDERNGAWPVADVRRAAGARLVRLDVKELHFVCLLQPRVLSETTSLRGEKQAAESVWVIYPQIMLLLH